ncbi:MAG: extracellular solute-binding protein [Bradyrhizobium sp.]|uniref:ABC transporter substrate-binding protein n=1 Tax=Bradyrhizobium sp. TaxID=376 RepID=UPI001DC1DAE3|nr:extracellular solute-binding protein [Bradyrhizobium sp.]MBV9566349.1 extracellular solute-binding protein [Bradyrhizobium sp.]
MRRSKKTSTRAAPALHLHGRPTLRVLGTEITLLEGVRQRAEADLGITLRFENLDFISAQRKAAAQPWAYDVYDQCFHNLDIVWFWRAIQPIELKRIARWGEVSDLTKTGRIHPGATIGRGDAPVTKLYAQPNGSLNSVPADVISMLPTVHNLDSFAYNAEAVDGELEPNTSWAALLDERWAGRVALVDEPAIGVFDAALAVQARGEMRFDNIGNMSTAEIDRLIQILSERRRAGYFCGFWKTAQEAADLMRAGQAVVQSMWSPGVSALRRRGFPVRETVPQEGYRAWHGGLCLSTHLAGRTRDAAYDYLNWWLDGWVGAVMARQGYYMSIPERVRLNLSSAEWDYWYEGEPASEDLPGPDGETTIMRGETRSGGAYRQRASRIAVWNTTMDEHNYLVRRWAQLVASGARNAVSAAG